MCVCVCVCACVYVYVFVCVFIFYTYACLRMKDEMGPIMNQIKQRRLQIYNYDAQIKVGTFSF